MGGNKTPVVDCKLLANPDDVDRVKEYHSGLMNGTIDPEFKSAPSHLRRLTILESALIRSFPPEYNFKGTKSAVYTQIGNAVPCKLAESVAKTAISVVLKGNAMNSKKKICYKVSSLEVQYLCNADKRLAGLIKEYGDLKYSLHADHYLFFVETIIGQMLSTKAADVITERMIALCGGNITIDVVTGLDRNAVRSIGLSNLKTDYIIDFTNFIRNNPSFFQDLQSIKEHEVLSRLTAIRGIGNWTAKMYLIFSMNKLDVLPFEDGAFLQVYKWLYQTEDVTSKAIMKKCKPWIPYSSIAARYFYRALDSGMLIEERRTIVDR
jgi:DNA-3-methyladenine glycosylase II